MSVKTINACKAVDLPPTAKFVLFMLADHAHDDGTDAFPSVGLLAWETGLSERAVRKNLRILEEAGVIEVTAASTRRRPTTYRLTPWRGAQRPPFQAPAMRQTPPASGGNDVPSGGNLSPLGGNDVPSGGNEVPPNRHRTVSEPPEEIQHAPSACEDVDTLPATVESSLPARRRAPDQLFESLVAVCHGTDDWSRLTGPERGVLNRAVKELKAVDATPAEVVERARAYVAWLGQRPTPVALVKHWNRLADPVQRLPRHELDALAEQQALAARMAEAERRERERLAEEAARSTQTSDRQLGDGHPPPTWLSDQHPRGEGESVRDYIRRLNAMTKEVG